jgi:hypothetical protein
MNDAIIPLVLGVILPPIIDLVNKYVANSKLRYLVALVFSLVAGAIIAVVQSGWDNVWADAGLVFAASQTVYKLWYEHSGLQTRIR